MLCLIVVPSNLEEQVSSLTITRCRSSNRQTMRRTGITTTAMDTVDQLDSNQQCGILRTGIHNRQAAAASHQATTESSNDKQGVESANKQQKATLSNNFYNKRHERKIQGWQQGTKQTTTISKRPRVTTSSSSSNVNGRARRLLVTAAVARRNGRRAHHRTSLGFGCGCDYYRYLGDGNGEGGARPGLRNVSTERPQRTESEENTSAGTWAGMLKEETISPRNRDIKVESAGQANRHQYNTGGEIAAHLTHVPSEVRPCSEVSEVPIAHRRNRYPTWEMCVRMPRHYYEMHNDALLLMAARGDAGARKERLCREVMACDRVDYIQARQKVEEIRTFLLQLPFHKLAFLPYKIGIACAMTAMLVSLPMVFHLPTAMWFNEHFVTTDVPQPSDMDTPLEISIWTWSWSEPMMGTLSFMLLCAQFARNQLYHITGKGRETPYQRMVRRKQTAALIKRYPQYNILLLADFAEVASVPRDSSTQDLMDQAPDQTEQPNSELSTAAASTAV
eukprot:g2827.t1